MTDRTAAEVMCCPERCNSPVDCCAPWHSRMLAPLHAAGYMIVPREATEAMLATASPSAANQLLANAFYRAMTEAGELK